MTAQNTYGRQNIVPLTNQSGGSVAKGDLVYVDTAHDDSFTTGTTGSYTGMVGIVMDASIGSGGTGLVAVSGYVPLVNVNASVTRGHFGKSYTVAKQATDAGASRVVGAFCQFTTGGTTPEAVLFGFPDAAASSASQGTPAVTFSTSNSAGSSGSYIGTDATIAVFDSTAPVTQAIADAAATGSAGTAARRDHKHGMPAATALPGGELDYAEGTGTVSVTSTTEGSETSILAGNSVTYDGTAVIVEFFCPRVAVNPSAAGRGGIFVLYEDSTSLGRMGLVDPIFVSGQTQLQPVTLRRKRTPSAGAHTYTVKGWKNNASDSFSVAPSTGGVGAEVPMYIRVTKA